MMMVGKKQPVWSTGRRMATAATALAIKRHESPHTIALD